MRGASDTPNAEVALARKIANGSGEFLLVASDAHQEETEGSRSARRHISTRGNSSESCKASANVAVTRAHGTRRPGDAVGLDLDGGVFNLTYGRTACERVDLICDCDWAAVAGQVAASMKDNSLAFTESSAGTLVKRIGLRDRSSTDGREMVVCGWARPVRVS